MENSRNAHDQPRAFLSYTSEDHVLAERIATELGKRGIDPWWAQWEIRAGDSIVQKVNEGLGDCTHFIVLLTSRSIDKPWVNAEMDAGFIRRLEARVQFIPLRWNLSVEQLTPLLRTLYSPEITDASFDDDVAQLSSDIHGVTRKPAIGSAPTVLGHPVTLYSPAAMAVADYFCRETKHAATLDPVVTLGDLSVAVDLSLEDTVDALHEVRAFIKENQTLGPRDGHIVWPRPAFWPEFDPYFQYNRDDPVRDASVIAARMINDQMFPTRLSEIAEILEWRPRRINPAAAYLMDRGIVRHYSFLGMQNWVVGVIERTDATRRFVKSRS